jgi:predicted TIM-barrel fold metal-dependent hydrolase
MTAIIDSDQHLYESRSMWGDHIDPSQRHEAIEIADDDLGYPWLTWRGNRLGLADVQVPRDTAAIGMRRRRRAEGLAPEYPYDETLPADYWDPVSRVKKLDEMGLDEAVVFPNFGLLWERRLSGSLEALTANMAAWNRWCAQVVSEGRGRIHPVAHLTLRDPQWLERQLGELSAAGVRLGMIAPSAVDGRPLSHPDHDRMWSAFVDNGVTPVFHVADQPRVIDEAFYPDSDEAFVPVVESVFIWAPPAIAVTDMIVNGTFARYPGLRVGIVELSSIWVPQFLLMLDGGWDFTNTLNGWSPCELDRRPSDYFLDQVRVSSFSYEQPSRLTAKSADIYMCCSDYPHSEGTATPVEDYARAGSTPQDSSGLFAGNVKRLLG